MAQGPKRPRTPTSAPGVRAEHTMPVVGLNDMKEENDDDERQAYYAGGNTNAGGGRCAARRPYGSTRPSEANRPPSRALSPALAWVRGRGPEDHPAHC